MVQENVNIAFRATGIPSIKRSLDDLGVAANNATRGFFLLQRAIYTLGGFGLAHALTSSLDALASMENRLKLTTNTAREMEKVQQDLFQVAIRSRQSWTAVSEIYNRTALSAKALGIAQADVLRMTESVSKAAAMSGATTQESKAALVQLGQAVASNRLGGDELRSILEQLPLVADYIAEYMTSLNKFGTVTRGNIRQLGKEGKITADIIVQAFVQNASKIDGDFAKMNVTIGQALEVTKTMAMVMVDEFDDATGASDKLAKAILLIGTNLDIVAMSAAAAGVAVVGSFAGRGIASVYTYVAGLRATQIQQTAVLARLVDIRNATAAKRAAEVADLAVQNKSAVQAATAEAVTAAARQATIRGNLAKAASMKAATLAEIKNTEFVIRNEKARSLQTGRFVALNRAKERLAQLTINLSRIEAVEAAQVRKLEAARVAQTAAAAKAHSAATAGATALTAAQGGLVAAQGRAAVAGAAQAGWMSRLAARFPLLTGLVAGLRNGVMLLWGILAANPIGAIITGIGLLVAAFIKWGNLIKVTEDGVVGLRDAVVAAAQLMWESVSPIFSAITDGIRTAFDFLSRTFSGIVSTLGGIAMDVMDVFLDMFGFPIRIAAATVAGINKLWQNLPAGVGAIANDMVNLFQQIFQEIVNIAIRGVNVVLGQIARIPGATSLLGELEIPELNLPEIDLGLGQVAESAVDEFKAVFAATDPRALLGSAWNRVIDRARQNVFIRNARQALDNMPIDPSSGGGAPPTDDAGGKKGKQEKNFAQLIAELQKETELLKLSNYERTIAEGVLKMEETLKRSLTDAERNLAVATLETLENMKLQSSLYEEIRGGQETAILNITALNDLYARGAITLQEYTDKMYKLKAASEAASGTFMGGFKSAIFDAHKSIGELGREIGDSLVQAIGRAADEVVSFAETGKFNFKSLVNSFLADILRLMANRAFTSIAANLLGGIGGGAAAGTAGAGASGAGATGGGIGKMLGGLFGFANGGSFMVGGNGGTDSQLVAFKASPDERVSISTPRQDRLAAKGSGGKMTVIVKNYGSEQATVTESSTADGGKIAEVIIGRAGKKMASDVMRGDSDLNRSLEKRYGLNPANGIST